MSRSLAAVRRAQTTVVVGPKRSGHEADRWIEEEPPGGGPAAALAAGAAATEADVVVVLAVDMPLVSGGHVAELLQALVSHPVDGVVLAPVAGDPQYLAGAYKRERLLERLAAGGPLHGTGLRSALAGLNVREVVSEAARDCDTPEELLRLEEELAAE